MTLPGTVQNGVVVREGSAGLPDGTAVTVIVEQAQRLLPAQGEKVSEEEYRRLLEIMDRIGALPIEGSGEPFRGRDHDKVLYGELP